MTVMSGPARRRQNEPVILTDAKVELVARLVAAGARRVEAVSFAHPKLVPAMAGAEAVMARVPRADGVAYAGLVLSEARPRPGPGRWGRRGQRRCASRHRHRQPATRTPPPPRAWRPPPTCSAGPRYRLFYLLATSFGCPFEGEIDRAG